MMNFISGLILGEIIGFIIMLLIKVGDCDEKED